MPNIAREVAKYPTPSLTWGKDLAQQSFKDLPNMLQKGQLKSYLASQTVHGNVVGTPLLKKASQNIILDTDTLSVFFEKLSGISLTAKSMNNALNPPKTNNLPSSGKSLPETRQFMDYSSGGDMQKTIVQNPINRSMDNVGNSQPVFPNKTI